MAESARKKVKYSRNASYFDAKALTGEGADDVKLSIRQLLESKGDLHPSATAFLGGLLQHVDAASTTESGPTVQASRLSLSESLSLAGIDYDYHSEDHLWCLKNEDTCKTKHLSEWAGMSSNLLKRRANIPLATAIKKIDSSKYMKNFRPESLTRTLFDIFICDRLENLDDTMSHRHLKVVPETQMEVTAKDGTRVSGRADWTLGYMDDKAKLHEMLLVVEAKSSSRVSDALSQLLLYLAAVQNARSDAQKLNTTVFGVATDSVEYKFVMLRADRKAFVSKTVHSKAEKGLVISFLDQILQDAIESSPHTTPTTRRNRRIGIFESSLRSSYAFGRPGAHEEKDEEDEHYFWQVGEINGIPVLQPEEDFEVVI